jgi:hypothetical protein
VKTVANSKIFGILDSSGSFYAESRISPIVYKAGMTFEMQIMENYGKFFLSCIAKSHDVPQNVDGE